LGAKIETRVAKYMTVPSVYSIRGHDYTIDEIQSLPERALSMGGTSKTHAKIDADRNVAFLTDTAGELVFDRNGMPAYTIIRKRGQASAGKSKVSDDMLKAIGNARRQNQQAADGKGLAGTKDSTFNLTLILIGIAAAVIPAVVVLFLFAR
jgi:hypothetical protein